jgi:hypothetical protein
VVEPTSTGGQNPPHQPKMTPTATLAQQNSNQVRRPAAGGPKMFIMSVRFPIVGKSSVVIPPTQAQDFG